MSKNSNTRNNIIHHVISVIGPLMAFHRTVTVLLILLHHFNHGVLAFIRHWRQQ